MGVSESVVVTGKPLSESAPADFAALRHRHLGEKEDTLRHLPAAQAAAAEVEQRGLFDVLIGDDAGRDLFIAQR